jgi:hypothetical protein
MKRFLLSFVCLASLTTVQSQNTDLPNPNSNIQTLPSGSYVIAMDNTNQLNNSSKFNLKTYGLIVTLLNNNKKVKWVIKAGKIKDSSDFSVNATKIKPSAGSAANFYFKGGPFVIFASDTTGIAAIVDTYNSTISNTNDKIKVYKTNASVSIDIRYDLTGFIPKGLILTDGGNQNIHTGFMSDCKIPSTNYTTGNGTDLLIKCYTFASEPHNDNTGSNVDNCIAAVKRFTQYGGNFLAQCHAVLTFENNTLGRFQTTTGITDVGGNYGSSITYPNADLVYNQYDGAFNISGGGSIQNWRVNATWSNSGYKETKATSDTTVLGSSVSKMRSGAGGMVFYLGNHNFGTTNIDEINGIRMFMNAFLTPAGLGTNCNMGDNYAWPLAIRLNSFQGNSHNGIINLKWTVATNEGVQRFTIEKSTDGIKFSALADVNPTFRSGEENYSLSDPMKSDKVFYRLKITEKSNFTSYSKILVFQEAAKATDRIKIMNNPVIDDKLTFEFTSSVGQTLELRVVDMAGKIQFKQTINANEGTNVSSILLPSALQDGLYILDVVSGNAHSTAKFIKQ